MRQRFGKVRGGGAWDFLEQLQARRCPKMGWYWLVSSPAAWNHGVSRKPQNHLWRTSHLRQDIEPHGLSWFPPFARPSGANCHDISVAEEDRIGSLASRSDVRRSWDRGVGCG